MLKATLRTVATAMGRWSRTRGTRRVVLCYHSIHPTASSACLRPCEFEAHCAWLAEHATVVPLACLRSAPAQARPVVSITFDDGFDDNHAIALPLLQRHGLTATFFITTGLIERRDDVLERFSRLLGVAMREIVPLDWSQIRELAAAGMTIGAHTRTHRALVHLPADEVESELAGSQAILEDCLGREVDQLAYPFGKPRRHWRPETIAIARRCGFRLGAAVMYRGVQATDDPLALPRFFAAGDDVATLAAKVRGDWDVIALGQERMPALLARLISPQDFDRGRMCT